MIKRSLALNGFSDRVRLFRNGLSDFSGRTFLNVHKSNKGGSTVQRLGNTQDETKTDPRYKDGTVMLPTTFPRWI